MTYFNAQDIKTVQGFFTERIYVEFDDNHGKYIDGCTYDELRGYIFNEFEYSEDEFGNPEVQVNLTTEAKLQANGDEYEIDEHGLTTFLEVYYYAICEQNFKIDLQGQKFTIK